MSNLLPLVCLYLSWVTDREQEEDQSRYDKRLSSDHSTSFMSSIQNEEYSYIMHGGFSMVLSMVFSPISTFPTTTPSVRGPGTLSQPAGGVLISWHQG